MNDNSKVIDELVKEQKEQTKYLRGIYHAQLFLVFIFLLSLVLLNYENIT